MPRQRRTSKSDSHKYAGAATAQAHHVVRRRGGAMLSRTSQSRLLVGRRRHPAAEGGGSSRSGLTMRGGEISEGAPCADAKLVAGARAGRLERDRIGHARSRLLALEQAKHAHRGPPGAVARRTAQRPAPSSHSTPPAAKSGDALLSAAGRHCWMGPLRKDRQDKDGDGKGGGEGGEKGFAEWAVSQRTRAGSTCGWATGRRSCVARITSGELLRR